MFRMARTRPRPCGYPANRTRRRQPAWPRPPTQANCRWACERARVRREAMAAGPSRAPPGCRPLSAHLLGRGDPHQCQAALDDLRDSQREFQPRPRKLWIIFNEEAARRVIVAAVPQRMEFGREIVEEESDPVRLVRHGSALDHAG